MSTVYLLAKSNRKFCFNIGESTKNTRSFSAILNTLAASSFISIRELLPTFRERIKPVDGLLNIQNDSGKVVPIVETIKLVFLIGMSKYMLTFLVPKQLVTDAIVGCNYCEYYFNQSYSPN